jgi:hypothetical protein
LIIDERIFFSRCTVLQNDWWYAIGAGTLVDIPILQNALEFTAADLHFDFVSKPCGDGPT